MSLTEQRDTIEGTFLKPHGIEIPPELWFEDQDVSGKKMRRKHFDEVMALAASGEIDGIVVARVSRFARTLVGALGAIKELDDHGVLFTSATEPLDTTTSTGKLLLNNFLSIAQWELDRITEQWAYFQSSAIARGIHISPGSHYGYRKGEDRKLYVILAEASVVKEIFRRRAQRQTWSAIARWLDDEYPRSGKYKWTPQGVKSIVQSRIYIGAAFSGTKVNMDAHEPIVTLAQWDAANAVVPDKRRTSGNGELPLLAGLIRCSGCRYAMTKVTDAKTGRIRGYKCNHKQTTGDCPAPAYVKSDDIDKLVQTVFGFWHFHSERTPVRPDEQRVKDAEDKLADVVRRFDAVAEDDARLEAMGADRFNADLTRRRMAIDQAESELQEARAALEQDSHRPIFLEDEWETFTDEQKHEMLTRAIDAVYVNREHFESGYVFVPDVDGDLFVRALIKWAHEDTFEKPGRGKRGYVTTPIPWPEPLPERDITAQAIAEGQDVAEGERVSAPGGMFESMWMANTPDWVRDPRAKGGLILPAEFAGITPSK
jgi:site-specific DNA recombinase